MKKQKDKPEALRNSVEGLFSTVDDLLENGKLTPDDQAWLEKELAEMEQKLKAYKQAKSGKVAAWRLHWAIKIRWWMKTDDVEEIRFHPLNPWSNPI